MPWKIFLTDEVNGWLDDLATVDDGSYRQVVYAIEALAEVGPNLGRPLVDRIKGSAIHNLTGQPDRKRRTLRHRRSRPLRHRPRRPP